MSSSAIRPKLLLFYNEDHYGELVPVRHKSWVCNMKKLRGSNIAIAGLLVIIGLLISLQKTRVASVV